MTERKPHLNGVASIINPEAAKKKWLRRRRLHGFLKKNLPGRFFDVLADKDNTIRLVRDLCTDCKTLIAVGGDGTIADVFQGIREAGKEKEITLGIIPLGSGNAFRQSLAIPKNIRKAIGVLHEGSTRDIELMDIGGKLAGFASIGATARVTQEKILRRTRGLWGHVRAGTILFKLPRWELEAELEEGVDDQGRSFSRKTFRLKVFDCVVAKSNYFGYGWHIAPRASLEDGYLDITFFEMSGFKYVLLLPLIFFGIWQRRQKHYKAKKLILRGKNLPVQYHGEYLDTMDKVEIRVLPRVFRVIGPVRREKALPSDSLSS
ncbi:MAG: diacylglycerol kinase family protein [Clostridiales bacterium]|nr:diacylglycerol kinase family protein [Clostridiales bacterium]